MTDQSVLNNYHPFRERVLSRELLSKFSTLDSRIVVRDTLWLWTQIVLAILSVAEVDHWALYLCAIPVIGTRYYALYIIGHDGLHRRLFDNKKINDLWNDLFVLGPIGAITRLNRHNHMQHHRSLGLASDPDRYKYVRNVPLKWTWLLIDILGFKYVWRAIVNVFSHRSEKSHDDVSKKYSLRDCAILVGWQVALLGGLTASIGWWAYFLLWWLPIYIFTFCADVTRVCLEHASIEDNPPQRLIHYASNWLERIFLSPLSMNHHVAHHIWPSIPYYRLCNATAALKESKLASSVEWRASYARQLVMLRGKNTR